MHACPRCLDRPLHAHPHDGGTRDDDTADALACGHCGGAWLTADAAQRVLPGRFGPLAGLPAVPTGFAALRCPECHHELVRRRVADVDIDVCAAHGVWFDHREVERIRDAAHHQHAHGDAALAAGLVVAAVAFTQSPAPPRMNASAVDVGTALDATLIVADIALTGAEVASATSELALGGIEATGSAIEVGSAAIEVGGGAIEVAGGAIEVAGGALEVAGGAIEVAGALEATGGVLDALAGIFDGLFSF